MTLSPEEEAYLNGSENDLQVQASSPVTSKLSGLFSNFTNRIKSVFSWGTPSDQAQGVLLDYSGNEYQGPPPPPKTYVNLDRMGTKAVNDGSAQSAATGCAWYSALNPFSQCNVITKAVTTKATSAVSGVGDFVSSTLSKTIIIMVIVGIAVLFLMSFVQAKAGKVANA